MFFVNDILMLIGAGEEEKRKIYQYFNEEAVALEDEIQYGNKCQNIKQCGYLMGGTFGHYIIIE